MYILDSDVLGFYLNRPDSYPHLCRKIDDADAKELLCTSIITVQEALAGRLDYLRSATVQKSDSVLQAYQYLQDFLIDIRKFLILPFDKAAYQVFQTIPGKVREGAVNDCRIAAIAFANDYTVITNNAKDFERIKMAIPVKVEYWATAPLSPP